MKPERVLIVLTAGAMACSTPSFKDRFPHLDPSDREAFVARYPELTEHERERLESGGYPKKLAGEEAAGKSDRIAALEIHASPDSAVYRDELRIQLQASLKYEDGRSADATRDVIWTVEPRLARIEEHTLVPGCSASDLEVSADFFGQRAGQRTFRIRRPIQGLELRRDEAFSGFSRDAIARFLLQAHCRDGSSSEVSCHTTWRSRSPTVEITGCGYVRVLDPEALRRAPAVELEAEYGGRRIRQTIRLTPPVRH